MIERVGGRALLPVSVRRRRRSLVRAPELPVLAEDYYWNMCVNAEQSYQPVPA